MIPDERDAEEHQPGERKKDADHLAGCLRAAAAPGKEGENADAPGGRRLNERQGRDRESGDVQDPAAETGTRPTSQGRFVNSSRRERTGLVIARGGMDAAAPCCR